MERRRERQHAPWAFGAKGSAENRTEGGSGIEPHRKATQWHDKGESLRNNDELTRRTDQTARQKSDLRTESLRSTP